MLPNTLPNTNSVKFHWQKRVNSGPTNTNRIRVETAVSKVWKLTNDHWILQLALPFVVEVCSEQRQTFEKILTPPESNRMGRVEK